MAPPTKTEAFLFVRVQSSGYLCPLKRLMQMTEILAAMRMQAQAAQVTFLSQSALLSCMEGQPVIQLK